ncbi:hypothetical protein MJO29_016871, partial [Puccinia striiformis f. sp. tritici]
MTIILITLPATFVATPSAAPRLQPNQFLLTLFATPPPGSSFLFRQPASPPFTAPTNCNEGSFSSEYQLSLNTAGFKDRASVLIGSQAPQLIIQRVYQDEEDQLTLINHKPFIKTCWSGIDEDHKRIISYASDLIKLGFIEQNRSSKFLHQSRLYVILKIIPLRRDIAWAPNYTSTNLSRVDSITHNLDLISKTNEKHLKRVEERLQKEGNFKCRSVVTITRLERSDNLTILPKTLEGPIIKQGNSILRLYDYNSMFIRVSIREEDGSLLQYKQDVDPAGFLKDCYCPLADQLLIAGQPFEFLCYSSLALRSHQAWFVCPLIHRGQLVHASKIRDQISCFSTVNEIPARYMARVAQAFTTTKRRRGFWPGAANKLLALTESEGVSGPREEKPAVLPLSFGTDTPLTHILCDLVSRFSDLFDPIAKASTRLRVIEHLVDTGNAQP